MYGKRLPILDMGPGLAGATGVGSLPLGGGAGSASLARPGQSKAASFEFLTTRKDELVGWARKFSLFPYPFVTACCAM